jgi:hypothetical protein
MWKDENNGIAPQRMTDALLDYEEAVREFSTNAAEFLRQVPLLTKARQAYERATIASGQLREILDKGDETLHRFMAQMQETLTFPNVNVALESGKPETEIVQTTTADGDKANAARV